MPIFHHAEIDQVVARYGKLYVRVGVICVYRQLACGFWQAIGINGTRRAQ